MPPRGDRRRARALRSGSPAARSVAAVGVARGEARFRRIASSTAGRWRRWSLRAAANTAVLGVDRARSSRRCSASRSASSPAAGRGDGGRSHRRARSRSACLSLPPLLTSLLLVFIAARTGWLPLGGMTSSARPGRDVGRVDRRRGVAPAAAGARARAAGRGDVRAAAVAGDGRGAPPAVRHWRRQCARRRASRRHPAPRLAACRCGRSAPSTAS